jgi:2-amino-4-hydroxy-6-hydroxymethyldihydropteridine diphosphokinase
MARAFLGLGSNLGDRAAHLQRAVAGLPDLVATSPVYETDPVGGPDDQGAYLNLVAELDTALSPRELLALCGALEDGAGRVREVRWGPRTLDVDVLWVDGVVVDEPDLQVPHPRMRERRFVLEPLADLAPDLVTDEELAAAVGDVRRVGDLSAFGDEGGR